MIGDEVMIFPVSLKLLARMSSNSRREIVLL